MNQEKIMQLRAMMATIEEQVQSPDGNITVTFNGQCQVKELRITGETDTCSLQRLLPTLINAGLVKVTEKINSIAVTTVV